MLQAWGLIIIEWPDTILGGESHKLNTVANEVKTEKYACPQDPAHALAQGWCSGRSLSVS